MATLPEPAPDALALAELMYLRYLEVVGDLITPTPFPALSPTAKTAYIRVAERVLEYLHRVPDPPAGVLPLTAMARRINGGVGHTRISIYTGRNSYARAHAGVITIDDDSWPELAAMLAKGGFDIEDHTL